MSKPAEELRVVLIGRTTTLVTSAKNIMEKYLKETMPKMTLVAALGLCHDSKDKKGVLSDIVKSILDCDSQRGPHVFLYVQEWENDFNSHDEKRVELLKKICGEKSMSYFLSLFINADNKLPKDEKDIIKNFLNEYKFGSEKFGVIGNDDTDREQVGELVKVITEMVEKNKGAYYTVDMFKDAQEALDKEIPKSENQGNTDDDAKESSLLSAARDLLIKLLGEKEANRVLKLNAWLAKKFSEFLE